MAESQQNANIFSQVFPAYFIDILQVIILILFVFLKFFNVIGEQILLFVAIFVVTSLAIRYLATTYLNFVIAIRNTGYFADNRTANFLTFDVLKFILILIALSAIIILGLNKILNNETIATLLGGLIGSLLTMRGSYTDLKPLSKKEMDEIKENLPDLKQQSKPTL